MGQTPAEDPGSSHEGHDVRTSIPTGVVTAAIVVALLVLGGLLVARAALRRSATHGDRRPGGLSIAAHRVA
jgi:hypothetical protein